MLITVEFYSTFNRLLDIQVLYEKTSNIYKSSKQLITITTEMAMDVFKYQPYHFCNYILRSHNIY